jgi:hypothetical protein
MPLHIHRLESLQPLSKARVQGNGDPLKGSLPCAFDDADDGTKLWCLPGSHFQEEGAVRKMGSEK